MKTHATQRIPIAVALDAERLDQMERQAQNDGCSVEVLIDDFLKSLNSEQDRRNAAAVEFIQARLGEIISTLNRAFPSPASARPVAEIEELLLKAEFKVQRLAFPTPLAVPETNGHAN